MNISTTVGATMMYAKAKKIVGYWTILLQSDIGKKNPVVQFKSLSKTLAEGWRKANEPPPASYQMNASTGRAVWRGREGDTA